MFTAQLAMAIDSLRANKLRSLLTMLGIIIGTGTLVAVLSLGNAVQGSVFEQFIDLGTRRVAVQPGDPTATEARALPGYGRLSLQDYQTLDRLVAQRPDLFRLAVPQVVMPLDLRAGPTVIRQTVVGTTARFGEIQPTPVAHGRFLTVADDTQHAPVVVLGSQVAADLLGTDAAAQAATIGTTIALNGQPLEVVGILAQSQSIFGIDDQALVPLSTLRVRLVNNLVLPGRGIQLDTILIGLQSEQGVDEVGALIRTTLRSAREVAAGAVDDFEIELPTEQLGVLAGINGAITGFVALVAGISLLVGGIGIMNIMLVAVTERTREIGVRKALGATDGDILGQFVLEAVAVSVIGGGIGVSGAIASVVLFGAVSGIRAPIAWGAVLLALGFAAAVGVGFGSYPARRAALLLPVDALRYE